MLILFLTMTSVPSSLTDYIWIISLSNLDCNQECCRPSRLCCFLRLILTTTSLVACGDASAFDLDISAARDMLTTNGVEEYLMMAGPTSSGRSAEQMAPVSQPQPLVSSAPILPPIPAVPSPLVPVSPVSSDRVHPRFT